jgi:hypothetical protein
VLYFIKNEKRKGKSFPWKDQTKKERKKISQISKRNKRETMVTMKKQILSSNQDKC